MFLYQSPTPTGQWIIDQVVDALRQTSTHRCDHLAKRLNVNRRELAAAWHLLTGTHLNVAIRQWRILQARDLLQQAGHPWTGKPGICHIPTPILQRIAVQCGWRNATVMKHALRRTDHQQLTINNKPPLAHD